MDDSAQPYNSHRAGFVNIVGLPNSGKSTLLNQLLGEKLSIVTHKPQTTRHRLFGILNSDDYQIVFSDTPGLVSEVSYKLHERMNSYIHTSFEDADIILLVIDSLREDESLRPVLPSIQKAKCPTFLILNKIDLVDSQAIRLVRQMWKSYYDFDYTFEISALSGLGVPELKEAIVENVPDHPPFFPKDELSDKSIRFFVSEIIREKIFLLYHQEIPYASQVVVTGYQQEPEIIRIAAEIYVERPTQKSIIIGKKGSSIKKLGTDARHDIEAFVGKKVFLDLFVKVKEGWRKNDRLLEQFGYNT